MGQLQALPAGQDAKLAVRLEDVDNGTQVAFTIYNSDDLSQIATVDGAVENRSKA